MRKNKKNQRGSKIWPLIIRLKKIIKRLDIQKLVNFIQLAINLVRLCKILG